MSHVIIIGGGIGGLLAAAAMAPHVDRLTIIERDVLDDRPGARHGTPQAAHVHGLLTSGRESIETLLPGITDDLVAAGALGDGDIGETGRWYIGGGLLTDCRLGRRGLAVSRPALEAQIRRRVRALPGVTVRDGIAVTGLRVIDDRVVGVEFRGTDELSADLVIDSSGRSAHARRWLSAAGLGVPDDDVIRLNLWYSTIQIPYQTSDLDGRRVVVSAPVPPIPRGGVAIAQEDSTWRITLFGYGERPPTDVSGLRVYARRIVAPEIAALLDEHDPISQTEVFSIPSSGRRRFETMPDKPRGYLAIADAICSFDPAFGQGMSVAALQAVELGTLCGRYRLDDKRLADHWYRNAARITDRAWTLTAGVDLALPGVTATFAPPPAWIGNYVRRVQLAARRDPVVSRAFREVTNLVRPAPSLLRPQIAIRTLLHSRPPHQWPRSLRSRRPPQTAPAAPARRSSPAPR